MNKEEIQFDSKTHTYTRHDVKYTPVSNTLARFKPLFPRMSIAKAIAKRDGVGVELILSQWQQKATASCVRGNEIHLALELYERDKTMPEGNSFHTKIIENFAKWRETKKGKSTPEEVIFSDEYKVAGTVDLPMKQGKHVDVWDFKTNAEMNNVNKYNKFYRNGLEHVGDTKYQGYALQLSVYALLYMERGLRPRHLGILWIDAEGNIHEMPVPFLYHEALIILQTYARYQ